MTELYDDCNWVKQKKKDFTDLSKEKIAWQDENMLGKRYEKFEKWREGLDWGTKKQTQSNTISYEASLKENQSYLASEIGLLPISNKTTDDNCTGDLILP